MSGCALFGHDGVVNMINRAFNLKLDRVGRIVVHDNVYIGHGATILPGVTIGPNSVVASGAVVNRDVAPNSLYGGVPARKICSLQDMVQRMKADHLRYPWRTLVEQRNSTFDPALQPELDRQRIAYFFREPELEPSSF
jgi:acyl-[acyl carrier protein]--UDP-N-acetylglucosamine O-acyltransferase